MRTVEEYRKNAEECRELAKLKSQPEEKFALEETARAWERAAEHREHFLKKAKED